MISITSLCVDQMSEFEIEYHIGEGMSMAAQVGVAVIANERDFQAASSAWPASNPVTMAAMELVPYVPSPVSRPSIRSAARF